METISPFPEPLGLLALGLTAGLLALNLVTFTAFALNKSREASGQEPLPEVMLLSLAALGGWPAAKLAQLVLRIRGQTAQFRSLLNLVALPLAAIAAIVIYQTVDLWAVQARAMAYVGEVTGTGPGVAAARDAAAADGTAEPAKTEPRRFGPKSTTDVGKRLTVPVKE